jgi:hypothetical protein
MERPLVEVTAEMIETANALVPATRVRRTRVSPVDTLGGILGEFAFAHWLTGDWRRHEVGENKGKADLFGLVEVKTSVYPFKETLNLVIREDYGAKFKDVYVQNIINVDDNVRKEIRPGTCAVICGFATHDHATSKPAEQMTMRGGLKTPYKVFTTPITELRPMSEFRAFFAELTSRKGLRLHF